MDRGDPTFLAWSFPLWLEQCLLFMASSFAPLTDSLESSMGVFKDSCAALAESSVFGCSVKDQRWFGVECEREW